jgi:serine/threonine-protein kinase HipA
MQMLAELKDLHVRVAKTQLVDNLDEDILLVERFDRTHYQPSHHFLSANSLINEIRITEQLATSTYSYGALAEFNMRYGAEPLDSHELFARMVFNICMGNTDDHSRNHAFVYSFQHRHWRLSKAYEVLPVN